MATEYQKTAARGILRQAADDFASKPRLWCQWTMAIDSGGAHCYWDDAHASRWCALGMINKIAYQTLSAADAHAASSKALDLVHSALHDMDSKVRNISVFNDIVAEDVGDVIKLFRTAAA